MNAKKYLSQAIRLNARINNKLEQVEILRTLATKVTAVLSDMPSSPTRRTDTMEDAIVRMVDLQNEVASDLVRLMELRKEIYSVICQVENTAQQAILEMRYLCNKDWAVIATELNYDQRYVFKLHGLALKEVDSKRH